MAMQLKFALALSAMILVTGAVLFVAAYNRDAVSECLRLGVVFNATPTEIHAECGHQIERPSSSG